MVITYRAFGPLQAGFLLLALTTSSALFSSPATDIAWQYIKQKNFTAAQATLSEKLKHSPNDNEAKFLYAQSLAWGKKNNQALSVLNEMLGKQPENTDFLVSKANILSWLNKNNLAIKTLQNVREISPGYKEAWEVELKLLKKEGSTKAYQQVKNEYYLQFLTHYISPEKPSTLVDPIAKTKTQKKNKYLLVGQNYGQLNIAEDDWYSTLLEYGASSKTIIQNNPYNYRLNFSLENSRRFGFIDNNISSKFAFQLKNRVEVTSGISISSENSLYPKWQILFQTKKPIFQKNIFEFKWQHKRYSSSIIDGSSFSFSRYWGAFLSKATTNFTAINNNDFTINFSGSLSFFVNDSDFIRFSLSRGNEIEYFYERLKIIKTEFTGLDGRWRFNTNWNAIFSIGHHKQGTIYTKNGIFFGLQRKF